MKKYKNNDEIEKNKSSMDKEIERNKILLLFSNSWYICIYILYTQHNDYGIGDKNQGKKLGEREKERKIG